MAPEASAYLEEIGYSEKFGARPLQAEFRMSLATSAEIRLNNAAKLIVNNSDYTYVQVDCNGYAGVGLDLDIEICRDYVIPLDPNTFEVLDEPHRVHGNVKTFFPTLNDFYAEINMDPFVVSGVENVKWRIDSVVVDFSDVKSPPTPASPPEGYSSPMVNPLTNSFKNRWKGFYMGNFSATLPKQFSENGGEITVGVEGVVIDDLGFSGHIYASDILPLDEGNAGGWAFSIDTIGLTIVANQLQDAGLDGLVHIPIISSANDCNTGPATVGDCLNYSAFIEPGNIYHFDVSMPDTAYCIDMWKAGSVKLGNNTTVKMRYEDGDFDLLAKLFGEININQNLGQSISVNIPKIKFERVELSNKEPYFSPGIWKFPTTVGADF